MQKGSGKSRINEAITARTVRLVSDGVMEIVSIEVALERARSLGLDLVEIVADADPPVCKIFDYSRHRYQAQKKVVDSRKKQKSAALKEVKFRPNIGDHDYGVKLRNILAFLERGDKVKVSLRFVGREMLHQDVGMRVMERIMQDTENAAKVELHPKSEGNLMLLVLAPRP